MARRPRLAPMSTEYPNRTGGAQPERPPSVSRTAMHVVLAAIFMSCLVVALVQTLPRQDAPETSYGYAHVTDARLRSPAPADWLMYRRTYDGWGYSPLDQITARNVADLAPAWIFPTGVREGTPQAAPIVNGNTMFVTTAEQVIALEADTGTLLWRYERSLPSDLVRPHPTNRGVALYDDKVYVGTLDAHVVALLATTGEVVWDRAVEDYRLTYYITLAPLVANDKVMVGTSGGEHGIRGSITALDALTGDEVWRRHTIPAPGEPGGDTWDGNSWRTGGGSVWLTGNYDPALNLTYWGVGNGGPWTGDARPGDNLYTNSTIALDADTGELRGHYQYHWNGSWDWDEASPPLLLNVDRGGRTTPALVHAGRNGYLWLLERSAGGMRFLDAHRFVHQNVFAGLDPLSGRPMYDDARVPGIGKRADFCPSTGGARNWPPEAYNPVTGLLYISAHNNRCGVMEGVAVSYRPGRAFVGVKEEWYRREGTNHLDELQAWNVHTGQRIWIREFPFDEEVGLEPLGAVLATAGDLVFLGGTDLRAFHASSGEPLWDIRPRYHRATGTPTSYAVDGVQYVAVPFQGLDEGKPGGEVSVPGLDLHEDIVVAFALDCQC